MFVQSRKPEILNAWRSCSRPEEGWALILAVLSGLPAYGLRLGGDGLRLEVQGCGLGFRVLGMSLQLGLMAGHRVHHAGQNFKMHGSLSGVSVELQAASLSDPLCFGSGQGRRLLVGCRTQFQSSIVCISSGCNKPSASLLVSAFTYIYIYIHTHTRTFVCACT